MADQFAEDYDSSDEELPPPAPNPYASLGEESIAKLVERASELRVITKRNYKGAKTNTAGAPPTVQQRMLWTKRFKEFCKAMNHKPGQIPTGEDIHRFMDAMVQVTSSRYKSATSLSYSWFHKGVKYAIEACKYEFKDFKLTAKDGMDLENLASRLKKAGAITTDPFREKQWLGCHIIQRCVYALLKDALENGTLSWDVVICRAATLVLISALGRGGDVVLSSHYAGSQMEKHKAFAEMSAPQTLDSAEPVSRNALYDELMCLQYEDIQIKVKADDGSVLFVAQFMMKQDKGSKESRKFNNRRVVINSQRDSAFNAMDPIAYVLVMALRFGVAQGTQIDAVVSDTLKRRDKTIQWLKPHYPVLPAYGPNSSVALESKPARSEQSLKTLRLCCELAGILAPVFLHDMRRGLASDLAYNSKADKVNVQEAAEALGHSEASKRRGVTKDYIGPDRRDTWSSRLQNRPLVEEFFGIDMVDAPFKRRKHTAPELLKKTCEDNDLDYGKRGDRERATMIIREQDKKQFLQQHNKSVDEIEYPLAKIGGTGLPVLKEKSANIITQKRKESPTSALDSMIDPQLLSSSAAPQILESGSAQHAMEDVVNDAALVTDHQLFEIADIIHGTKSSLPTEDIQALMDPVFDDAGAENVFQVVQIDAADFKQLIGLPSMQFMDRLSRINTVRHSQSVAMYMPVGNSRDEATRFKIPCTNAMFGCTKLWETDEQLRQHLVFCKSTSVEAHASEEAHVSELATRKASGRWVCDECGKSFASKGTLTTHKKDHSWVPKTCDVEDCKSKTVFKSAAAYAVHQSDAHTWNPCNCPLKDSPDCTAPTKLFDTRGTFKYHLSKSHKLNATELKQYLQKPASHGTWVPIKCLVPDCVTSIEWKTRKDYRGHLYETHDIHNTAPYMPF